MTAKSTGAGCANVTITFTSPGNQLPSAFTLVRSPSLKGPFSAVAGVNITGGPGTYQAAFSTCSTGFYEVALFPTLFTITGITAKPTGSGCANVTINFTAPGSPAPTAFSLVSAATLKGPFTAVAGANITGGPSAFQATFSTCSTSFYEIQRTSP
jgi:hypothetical protein